jgi:hypothetical protein
VTTTTQVTLTTTTTTLTAQMQRIFSQISITILHITTLVAMPMVMKLNRSANMACQVWSEQVRFWCYRFLFIH